MANPASNASVLDPRLHPYKADIAAKDLQGQVQSERYVEGTPHQVIVPICDLFSARSDAARATQALYGESFMVYQREGDWAWGQLQTDRYVGWIKATHVSAEPANPATHKVAVALTHATDETIKVTGTGPLPMGAQLRISDTSCTVHGSSAPFVQSDAGTIPANHVRPMDDHAPDWVDVAQLFHHTPYVWGGRCALGIDCSALVQLALQQAGIACPRDSDMQEALLGHAAERAEGLRRGDLVFWPGHVGIMVDAATLFHANAFAMATVYEPLDLVEARAGTARAIKRL